MCQCIPTCLCVVIYKQLCLLVGWSVGSVLDKDFCTPHPPSKIVQNSSLILGIFIGTPEFNFFISILFKIFYFWTRGGGGGGTKKKIYIYIIFHDQARNIFNFFFEEGGGNPPPPQYNLLLGGARPTFRPKVQ